MIYADNSATTFPKPQTVYQSVNYSTRHYGGNSGRSGHRMSLESAEQIYRCRETTAEFFHAEKTENIIFTPNCTYSLNTVIKGFVRQGEHIVISDLEHNSVLRAVNEMTKTGASYTVAQTVHGDFETTLNHFRRAINEKTKLIVLTHASNVTGTILPVSRIIALAHQYNSKVLVDTAQTAGVIPIDVEAWNADFVAAAGHKGLMGIMGTGLLYIRNPETVSPLIFGGTGSSSLEYSQPEIMPDKFESGTSNLTGISSLKAGIEFIQKRGIEHIHRYEYRLIEELYAGLKKIPEVILYTQKTDIEYQAPLLSFNIGTMPSEDVAEILNRRYRILVRAGLHCAPLAHKKLHTENQGTVRISLSVFNTSTQIQTILQAVKNISKKKKKKVNRK